MHTRGGFPLRMGAKMTLVTLVTPQAQTTPQTRTTAQPRATSGEGLGRQVSQVSQTRIYVASKSRHWPWWAALRAAGIPIVASWVDAGFNHAGAEPPDWALHWLKCIDEAAAADVVLMFARADENQNGALIEVGAALAAGKRVFLVSPHDWSWRHLPHVRRFETLADAIAAIVGMGKNWTASADAADESSNTVGATQRRPTRTRKAKGA